MNTNLTNLSLDEMILQYSENPFIDRNIYIMPAVSDPKTKRGILNRLLLIASNLFSSKEPAKQETYKRRYCYEVKE
jgi:hypothetical protein